VQSAAGRGAREASPSTWFEQMSTNLAERQGAGRSGLDNGPAGSPRLLAMLTPWRLRVAGCILWAGSVALLFLSCKAGHWLVDRTGRPIPNDFTYFWIGGERALHGATASLYDPTKFKSLEAALVGPVNAKHYFNPHWPYPPTFFLVLAPLARLSYLTSFVVWEAATLLSCVAVIYLIVRRWSAIILTLASPFSALDVYKGQTGFLASSLVGGALLALRRRPLLAGFLVGCLTYKPQYGLLFPVALTAAKEWRALSAAATTAALLAAASVAAFGTGPWLALPHALLGQAGEILLRDNPAAPRWIDVQSVYGLVRASQASARVAWAAQGAASAAAAVIVWFVWRSRARFSLKAALLMPATLIASPYGWVHDLTLLLIPMAFLVTDQIEFGLLRGEQTIMVGIFSLGFAMVFGPAILPAGLPMMMALIGIVLRRLLREGEPPGLLSRRRIP
jgi:arabinofuranan 3-O-arabinosyltransferase